jgi:hypothetical protein
MMDVRALLTLMAGLACFPATAEPQATVLDLSEADVLPRLIESTCLDIAEDWIGCEQVMLLASRDQPDRADLVILSDRRGDPASVPLAVVRNIVFNGSLWGMAPSLEQAASGALMLRSEQIGAGRYPWSEALTIVRAGSEFVVAGFFHSSYDRARGGGMSCSVNLLTGAYTAEASRVDAETDADIVLMDDSGNLEPLRILLADWPEQSVFPGPCGFALDALYAQ